MSIVIKKITSAEDLNICAPLLKEVYNAPPWNDNWTVEKAHQKLTCFYNSPKFSGFMALQDEVLLGCCVGNVEPYFSGDYFYLKEMFVSVQAQRAGVGSLLLSALVQHLQSIDIHTMILFTSQEFFPVEFYKKNNFEILQGMCMMQWQQG